MILFLGLRAEEPKELYHRNPSLKGRADTGCKWKLPGEIVVFALHKLRLSSAKNANSVATLRIPIIPARDSDLIPATHSDPFPAT
jgi:hypothetical protein